MNWTDELEVELLRAVHPGEFYIRLKKDVLPYEYFKKSMKEYYVSYNLVNMKKPSYSPINEAFLIRVVYYEDQFRRCILNEKIVYLFDEGRFLEHQLESYQFYKIPVFLKLFPPFCFRCYLHEIPYNNILYSESEHLVFQEQFTNDTITSILLSLPSSYTHAPQFQSFPVKVTLVELFSSPVEPSVPVRTYLYSKCLTLKLVRSEENVLVNDSSFNTECEIIGVIFDDNNNDLEQKEPVTEWKCPIIPSSPGPHDARVTHIDCYGQIYLHLMTQVEVFREVRRVATVEGKMNDFCKSNKSWNEGDVCLAAFEDDLYYRGIIININKNVAIVLYVDYGNLMEVELEQLKIPYANGNVPILTLRVVVNNVVPKDCGLKWPRKVLEQLYSLMYYGNDKLVRFTMLPGHRGFPLPVLLEVFIGEEWASMANILIGSRHGKQGSPLTCDSIKSMNNHVGNIDGIYALSVSESDYQENESDDNEEVIPRDQDLLDTLEVIELIDRI